MAGHQRWFSGKTGVTDLLCEDEGPARRHFEIPDCIVLIPAHHTIDIIEMCTCTV